MRTNQQSVRGDFGESGVILGSAVKTSRAIFCFAGGASLVALALVGLCALGPDHNGQQQPGFVFDCTLLVLFWIGYLACLLSLLVWFAGLVLGCGNGRKPRQGGDVE